MSAQSVILAAALLAVKEKANIHYTQNSPARWEGIADRLLASNGQYPKYIDCSSFATWCLGQALWTGPDILNGTSWRSGYTGTLDKHGRTVSAAAAQVGDLVFYGTPVYHVAIVIGRQNGVLICASHGEESGPYVIKYNQWGVNSIRRYLSTVAVTPPVVSGSGSANPMHNKPIPAVIARGTNDYFGLITGPNESHGGAYTSEQPDIKLIQLFLNWHQKAGLAVDGKFGASTKAAVAKFQHASLPGTTDFGNVWYDDWQKMASY